MNKKEIAKEFTRQMLDQNTPSINFEQVTNMLKQIEQHIRKYSTIWTATGQNIEKLSFSFTDHHSQLKLSEQHLQRLTETLSEQLTELSTRFSKYQKVISLKTLLDAHSRGSNLSTGNEPDMVDRELKEKERKKRRGLRM